VSDAGLRRDNVQMTVKLAVIVLGMFAFGYALVPLYKHICEALGINVLTVSQREAASFGRSAAKPNSQVDASRTITVEFDANARGPWSFKPQKASLQVHPGELATVVYEFRNEQSRTMSAQAIPSYAPKQATAHFNKLECFCFNEYTLAGGVRHRPQAAQGREDHHPVVHLLRGGRQEGGRRAAGAPHMTLHDEAPARKGSLLQAFRAVAWSFFGIRKGSEYEKDVNQLKPGQVIVAGLVAAALFVVAIVVLVRWVVASGVAT
jgi:cytochrome c oxidase assembly protein subunit 11